MRPTITKDQIKEAFLRMVQYWPYQKMQPNTFGFITGGELFTDQTLGKDYEDYLAGDFWARDWVNGGAVRSEMNREYPILGFECKRITKELLKKDVTWATWIVLADVPVCGYCDSDDDRGDSELETDLTLLGCQVLEMIKQMALYDVDGVRGFWPIGIPEAGVSGGEFTTATRVASPLTLDNWINDQEIEFAVDDRLFANNARALSFPLSFSDCITTDITPEYVQYPVPEGLTKCPTCP